jgi:AcrR family transcriptional regulator
MPRGQSHSSTDARRPRRSSAEVRALVLNAAVETFASDGYGGATTREIARRAGVLESTMFRIFPTKEALYEAAVVQPFEAFLEGFHDRWMSGPVPGGDPQDVLRQFVVGMHELVRQNRSIISAVNTDAVSAAAQRAFDGLEQVGNAIAANYGLDFDVAVAVRIATVAVTAVSLLEDSLFPAETGIGSDRIVNEMVRMLVGATLYKPTAPSDPAASGSDPIPQ